MFFTFDRIEDNSFAVLVDDDGKIYNAELSALPKGSKTGDVFTYENGMYIPAAEEAASRKERIREKRNNFFNKLKSKQEDTL